MNKQRTASLSPTWLDDFASQFVGEVGTIGSFVALPPRVNARTVAALKAITCWAISRDTKDTTEHQAVQAVCVPDATKGALVERPRRAFSASESDDKTRPADELCHHLVQCRLSV